MTWRMRNMYMYKRPYDGTLWNAKAQGVKGQTDSSHWHVAMSRQPPQPNEPN